METLEAYHRAWQAHGRAMAARHGAEAREKLRTLLATAPPIPRPPPPEQPARDEERRYRRLLEKEVAARRPYPRERFAGRGIVLCGGGVKYFPCAWVTIQLLRHHGCKLPIEVWHLGPNEMSPAMRALLAPLGVETVDALEVRRRHPVLSLRGWELKPYALLHCRFAEALLLDADNAPVRDPSFLFDEPAYRRKGALFWPDFWQLAAENPIWRVMGVPYRAEPAFESGQIVVHKRKCWKALRLAAHLNEHSAWYYRFIHGDKDTFHLAWARLRQPYAMPAKRLEALEATMCQHDLQGKRLFQHRNSDKWRIDGRNRIIPGFQHEALCRRFLDELRRRWFPATLGVRRWEVASAEPALRAIAQSLVKNTWDYHRVGHDRRPLRLRPNGLVGKGAAAQEFYWHLRPSPRGPVLEFFSATARTCRLLRGKDGVWRGRWEICEKMPIRLRRLPASSQPARSQPEGKGKQSGASKNGQEPARKHPETAPRASATTRKPAERLPEAGNFVPKAPAHPPGFEKTGRRLPPGVRPLPKAVRGIPADLRQTGIRLEKRPPGVREVRKSSRKNYDAALPKAKNGQKLSRKDSSIQKSVNPPAIPTSKPAKVP